MAFLKSSTTGKSFWTVADQGVVSLGTFLTNVILARTLLPVEYGEFAIILGLLLFFVNVHSSLIIYPLSVEIASSLKDKGNLIGISLFLTLIVFLPVAVIFGLGCWILGFPELGIWVGIALIFWLFQENFRRSLMAELRYSEVIWGDAVSYLGQAGLIWYLSMRGMASVQAALLVIAVTSAAAGLIQLFQVGFRKIAFQSIGRVARVFWELGKWSLSTILISILATEAFLWTLAFFHGSGEVGEWQAMLNLLGLTHPILFGISNLIVPAVAQAKSTGGFAVAKTTAYQLGIKGGVVLIPYFVLLLIYPDGVLRLFYGADSPYLSLGLAVRVMAFCYFLMYLSIILGGFLKGLKESKLVFVIQSVSTVAAVLVGLPLAALGGINGAAFGNAVTLSAKIVTNLIIVRRVERQDAGA